MSAYEREGVENMKQALLRRWGWMDGSKSALHTVGGSGKRITGTASRPGRQL